MPLPITNYGKISPINENYLNFLCKPNKVPGKLDLKGTDLPSNKKKVNKKKQIISRKTSMILGNFSKAKAIET